MKSINVVVGISLFGLITIGLTSLLSSDLIRLFNAYRPVLLTGGGEQWISSLIEHGVKFREECGGVGFKADCAM